MASSTFVHGITPRPIRRSRDTGQYSSPSQSLYARTAARYASASVISAHSRGPICMFGNSTSAPRPSMSCSRRRCSGGPTPAVSSTVTPNGCHVSLVRPARRSRNGTGRGSAPGTRMASPPSGSLIVRGTLSLNRAGTRTDQRSGKTSRCPSLERSGGKGAEAMDGLLVAGFGSTGNAIVARRSGPVKRAARRRAGPPAIGRTPGPPARHGCRRRRTIGLLAPGPTASRRDTMGEILALGLTHYPPLGGRDENMARILKRVMEDPDLPDHLRRPEGWPEPMRREWGADQGLTAAREHRAALRGEFQKARRALDDFAPDAVVIWGDDQYENF